MFLQRLTLNGFKSFANKTVLSFPKPDKDVFSITAIVGPNGCGKTNISDSVRWALGEQSLKALRGKKSHDIIFSGSKQKKRLSLAEVNLLFNNEDGSAPIDYREFTITRKIYRSGEGEYLINQSRTKLQDILLLLAKTNFGQKSFSIIGQGMIEQVLVSSPSDRKIFFDEATGVKQFIYKRDAAVRKIQKSKENLTQAEIALSEVAPRIRSLTRQINKLAKKKEIEKKLKTIQERFYAVEYYSLTNCIEDLQHKLKQQTKKQKQIQAELQSYHQESKHLVYEKLDTKYESLQSEHQSLISQKNKYISQQSVINAQIDYTQEKNRQRTQDKSVDIEPNEVRANIINIKNLQNNLIAKLETPPPVIPNERSERGISYLKTSELEKIKTLAQRILKNLQILLTSFQPTSKQQSTSENSRIKTLQQQKKQISQKIKKCEKELETINSKLSQFSTIESGKKKQLFSIQQKIQKKQYQLDHINNTISDIKIELAKYETKKQDIEDDIKSEMKISPKNLDKPGSKTQPRDSDKDEIEKLKRQLELIGGIDPEVEKEYPQVKERYEFLTSQTKDLKKTLHSLNTIMSELVKKIHEQFRKNFAQINTEFDRYFKIIFGGGSAKIIYKEIKPSPADDQDIKRLNNEVDPYQEKTGISAIEIFATPPGKKIKSIEMLSGGEKALTALALICSIIAINKPPFVVLDEVDAALDQENSFRFTGILKELRRHTQFIVITHNQQTIEIADILYGVTMGRDSISRLISLKLE